MEEKTDANGGKGRRKLEEKNWQTAILRKKNFLFLLYVKSSRKHSCFCWDFRVDSGKKRLSFMLRFFVLMFTCKVPLAFWQLLILCAGSFRNTVARLSATHKSNCLTISSSLQYLRNCFFELRMETLSSWNKWSFFLFFQTVKGGLFSNLFIFKPILRSLLRSSKPVNSCFSRLCTFRIGNEKTSPPKHSKQFCVDC